MSFTKGTDYILRNQVYCQYEENCDCGTIVWGKSKVEVNEDTEKRKQTFKEKPLVIAKGNHQYIITKKHWETVQQLIDNRKGKFNSGFYIDKKGLKRRKKTNNHLFTKVLVCPECGGRMNGSLQSRTLKDGTKIKEVYYKCYESVQSGQCKPNSLKEDNIKELVMGNFHSAFKIYYNILNKLRLEAGQQELSNKVVEQLEDQF